LCLYTVAAAQQDCTAPDLSGRARLVYAVDGIDEEDRAVCTAGPTRSS